jgi:hypothetical protein
MADEELTIAQPELETPAIEGEQQQVEEPNIDPDTGEPIEQEELEEFEWNGKLVRGPKGLKDGVLMHKDYTQKRQTDAETARQKAAELEAREAEINHLHEATEAEVEAKAGLKHIKAELDRFKDYDFAAYQAHYQQDPMPAQQAWAYKQDLLSQQAQFEGTITKTQQERTAKAQQETAKRWQETGAYAQKSIPGWSNDLANKVLGYAETEGVPKAFLERNMSPVLIRLMHRAYIGEQTLSRPAQKAPAPTPEPLKIVAAKGNPSPTALSDNLSAEEWTRRRNAQIKKRAN